MATNATALRPKPRFAGATELVVIGVEKVVEGLSEGEWGAVGGGVFLLLLVVVAGVVGRWWSRRTRRPPLTSTHLPLHEGVEMETFTSDIVTFAPTPSMPSELV